MSEKSIHWQSSENMSAVANESIQTTVTSPPYFDLKDYGHDEEIGSSDESYEAFLERLRGVWEEVYHKLTDDGTLWVVSDSTMSDEGEIRLLPQDIVDDAVDIGFSHLETVVWYKPTSLARMNPKLLANKKEYIMLLSKSETPKIDPEVFIEAGEEDPAVRGEGQLGDLWRFPLKRGSLGGNILHKAPFPLSLVKRMIRISSDPGDTVLDPFLGSGTTAEAALELDRGICGYEINEEFKSIVSQRIEGLEGAHQQQLDGV